MPRPVGHSYCGGWEDFHTDRLQALRDGHIDIPTLEAISPTEAVFSDGCTVSMYWLDEDGELTEDEELAVEGVCRMHGRPGCKLKFDMEELQEWVLTNG